MDITTNDDWQWAGDSYDVAFATTSDPRVVAVIERDTEQAIFELFDGDAINPIIYVDHRRGLKFSHEAGYDGGEAELMQRAYDEWGWDGTARRWLWIFHGIAAENAYGGQDRDGNWIVATSTAFIEHIGNEPHATYEDARQDCMDMAKEVGYALDGDVYGIGYATAVNRVMDDGEPIDPTDVRWTMDIQCWGFIGEEYAQRSAASFEAGEPVLEEMLDESDVFGDAKRVIEGRL